MGKVVDKAARGRFNRRMQPLPDLSLYSHKQKDALIRALWEQVQTLTVQVGPLSARVAELEAKLSEPPKTPGNSSVTLPLFNVSLSLLIMLPI